MWILGGQKRAVDPMELELQEVVSLLIGVLGTELVLCKGSIDP